MRRGISIISGVIFLAITIAAVMLVYQAVSPAVKKVQSAAAVEGMKGVFSELDEIIQSVASEGTGSKRTFDLTVDVGKVIVNKTEDAIYWQLETNAEVVSPRTSQRMGSMTVGSNMETRGYEGNYTFSSPQKRCYILENEHLRVYLKKIGTPSSHASYNTSNLLVAIYNKDMDRWLNDTGFLDIGVDFNSTSKRGTGFTMLLTQGYNLPYGTVSAFMNSSHADYHVNFTLESGADFIEIEPSG